MSIKDELVFDFAVNIPRLVICGDMVIIDNVKRIAVFSDTGIIVHNGTCYTSIEGERLTIKELGEERMIIKGELETVQFFETL
jgi:sporulation protein YqfC